MSMACSMYTEKMMNVYSILIKNQKGRDQSEATGTDESLNIKINLQ
jgi:hypothetical protein